MKNIVKKSNRYLFFFYFALSALSFLFYACGPTRLSGTVSDSLIAEAAKITPIVDSVFKKIPGGSYEDIYAISSGEKQDINKAHGEGADRADVYGEIEDVSLVRIIERIGIGPGDKVADLGSGRGRMPLFILLKSGADLGFGVELSATRAAIASQVEKIVQKENLLAPHQSLKLVQGDMTKVDLPQDLTVVIMDSVLFSTELLNKMAERLSKIPTLRAVVMVHQGFPNDEYFEEVPPQENLPMTWERHRQVTGKLMEGTRLGPGTCSQCNVRFYRPKK